ncbi:MAG: DEAD/DEAH box helicase [Candidatus Eisenbacteria bacterium]|nr:DEAD/DEAH box helicase [Candidatus Latescibacterota bacterium]MBD3301910.1 DEAD/DEAH box helicase [Candidatus Eisenbacteria bacterium]
MRRRIKITDDLLGSLHRLAAEQGQTVHVQEIPPRPARRAEPALPLSPTMQEALDRMGIETLYTHQAQAIDAIREGRDVVVVTGTASGKTLCYNVPILETAVTHPEARALYLFPTKALAQDQLRTLRRFQRPDEEAGEVGPGAVPGPFGFHAGTYDGDTPAALRTQLRERARILLTNPDMLHSGILPNHARWADFFSRLSFVVADEIHVYRGIFGSHAANVFRRLLRIAEHYGARPQLVFASATIANPGELAERLTGRTFTTVSEDGSPRGRKHFVFWNPPRIDASGLERRSSNLEARDLLVSLLRGGYQAIGFVRARLLTEVLLRYCQEELARDGGGAAKKIRAYRGGYLPEERRAIEKALFDGDLRGVISTNALELGIDVGSLDAAVLVGFPGTIASTWQQAGRAGRREDESVAILVGHNLPIDQYLMRHPAYFFERTPEHAVIDPENPHILLSHLRCAVYELPLRREEERDWGEYAPAILDLLGEHGEVKEVKGRWYSTKEGYPASNVSLRNAAENVYTITETGRPDGNRVIGTIDEPSAFPQVHPQAIYMHDAETFFVDRLDTEEKVAYVHRADVDYYTQAVSDSHIEIVRTELEKRLFENEVGFGDLNAHTKVCMFKKIKFGSRDSIGYGNLELPSQTLETMGLWITPSLESLKKVTRYGRIPAEGLWGIANVLPDVVSLFAMCDPRDLGTLVDSKNVGVPAVFLYDKYPGGLGFAQKTYHMIEEVLEGACDLIHACPCGDGCPSCVGAPLPPHMQQDPDAMGKGRIPDKEAALVLLHAVLGKPDYVPKAPVDAARRARVEAEEAKVEKKHARRSGPERPLPPRVVTPLPTDLAAQLRRRLGKG